jgi:hypothetical protein
VGGLGDELGEDEGVCALEDLGVVSSMILALGEVSWDLITRNRHMVDGRERDAKTGQGWSWKTDGRGRQDNAHGQEVILTMQMDGSAKGGLSIA